MEAKEFYQLYDNATAKVIHLTSGLAAIEENGDLMFMHLSNSTKYFVRTQDGLHWEPISMEVAQTIRT